MPTTPVPGCRRWETKTLLAQPGGSRSGTRQATLAGTPIPLDIYTPGGYIPGMDDETRKKVLTRLNRAEGQVAALRRMVDQDTYCVDVLTQVAAAQGALGRAGEMILSNHIETCVSHAFESGSADDRAAKVDELMEVFSRYSRIGAR